MTFPIQTRSLAEVTYGEHGWWLLQRITTRPLRERVRLQMESNGRSAVVLTGERRRHLVGRTDQERGSRWSVDRRSTDLDSITCKSPVRSAFHSKVSLLKLGGAGFGRAAGFSE